MSIMDIDKINLCDMTESDLKELEMRVHDEVIKREQAREKRAINNFKKAFEELLLFVDIIYEDEETGEFADLRDFNKFNFE